MKIDKERFQAGWEREFWSLLSPETAELLKAELAKKPLPVKLGDKS